MTLRHILTDVEWDDIESDFIDEEVLLGKGVTDLEQSRAGAGNAPLDTDLFLDPLGAAQ